MPAQRTQTSLDIVDEPQKRPSFARKSDTFLHTRLARSEAVSDQHVARIQERQNNPQGSTAPAALRDRLSQMFDDSKKPRERRSVDAINTFDHRSKLKDKSLASHNFLQNQVPDRRSSLMNLREASLQDFPSWRLPPSDAAGKLILNRGRAESPVKRSIAKDSVSSDKLRLSPSRTFIRPSPPVILLQSGNIQSKRIDLSIDLNAPLFVGGGTIEGKVNIDIDRNYPDRTKKKDLLISKLSVDIVGCELMGDGRK